MSTISLRLPESLHARVRLLAHQESVSINQMITLALSEKIAALMTEDYLHARGKRADKQKFLKILKKVPNREPSSEDRL
jgi:hypothetical protein